MEIEYKFAASAATLAAVLQDPMVQHRRTEPVRTLTMRTRYFDTPDALLRQAGITLRLREENDRTIACCKSRGTRTGSLSAHEEWEVEAQELPDAIPALVALGAPALLLELDGLRVTATAAFTRRCAVLRMSEQTLAELSCDEGFLAGPTEQEPLSELELELKSGALEDLTPFLQALRAHYALPPEPRSKLARALALG